VRIVKEVIKFGVATTFCVLLRLYKGEEAMRVFVFVILLLFLSFPGRAQLTTSVQNPTTLVNNIFLGDANINIFNVSFQGAATAIGSFTNPNTNLGISKGIVMTTGTILGDLGPCGPNTHGGAGIDNNAPGYPLLTNLVGRNTHNASVLSFDFQTCSDSIEFRYVFGSEEYSEFVGSKFNDVFGFFISGPGFAGQQNIARLPNGSPVTINNVNNGNSAPAQGVPITGPSNPQYFVHNGKGGVMPYQKGPYIQYDGFTKVLTAKAKVSCGATYHLIMAIADVSDALYDSGVFLEAQSFKAVAPIKTSYSLSSQAFVEPNALVKACSDATIRFERSECNMNQPVLINVHTSGTAVKGVDYQHTPSTITISSGMSYVELPLIPIYDGTSGGADKTVQFVFNYIDNCGQEHNDTMDFILRDMQPLVLSTPDVSLTCPGDKTVLTPSIVGGGGQYHYLWSTGDTTSSITIQPSETSSYSVVITDECSGDTISGTITVHVPVPTPLVLVGSPDEENICPYVPTQFFVNASGGFGGYQYLWYDNWGEVFETDSVQYVLPARTTVYTVEVTDACGLTAKHSLTYTVLSPPLVVDLMSGMEICPGDSIELRATVTGGYGSYYYYWTHSGEKTPSVWVNPWFTTSYDLIVSDDCQTFTVTETSKVIVVKPKADFIPVSSVLFNNLPITFHNLTSNATSYIWSFGDGDSSTVVHPNHVFLDPGMYLITLIAADDKGCLDSIKKNITIVEEHYIYIPNAFTPDGDRTNAYFSASTLNIVHLHIDIFDRWGTIIFSSDDLNFQWDGTYNDKAIQDGLYPYKVIYVSTSGVQKELTGHVNVLH